MSKINLLSSKIYNRIAAGEVVERPASVVKELVENSIDAGAKHITVEINGGGISQIIVNDDGCGIEKSEIDKALMPHATSKISKVGDLDAIATLGFRGEALPSIASVSKISLKSRTAEQDVGYEIKSEGGDAGDIHPCGASLGTTVTVKNLFFNTPAREKFLKSERAEEGEITSLMAKFILG
ncbi:MAG: ATP-binding protein, partial [Clostridia bacterium]|nr:ATP-binding protein [Clostridia bacterium]